MWNWGHQGEFLKGGNSNFQPQLRKLAWLMEDGCRGRCSKKKNKCKLGTSFQECSSSAELLCPPHWITHLSLSRCYPDANRIVLSLTGPRGHLSRKMTFFFSNFSFLKKLADVLDMEMLYCVLHILKGCCLISSRRTPKPHLSFQTVH